MEDGLNAPLSEVVVPELPRNGVVSPVMAKDPDGNIDEVIVKPREEDKINNEDTKVSNKVNTVQVTRINGDNITDSNQYYNDSYDSESDALVIDESVPRKKKSVRKKKLGNQTEEIATEEENSNIKSILANDVVTHSNPFFNESLFELSQLHSTPLEDNSEPSSSTNGNVDLKKTQKRKNKPKPKLKEYAQYLGLQPTVQFKCSKCGQAGFESLSTLHEHIVQCDSVNVQATSTETSCSSFKLTRRVFLCSACGTYYENWNLYMHMLEFHKRYICLYCLGMFKLLEDLCQHIQSRHNLVPGHKNSPDEFFNVYNEPCYVICCECNKLFNEQDNFFYHNCVGGKNSMKNKKVCKQQITPENHVTGETETNVSETEKDVEPDVNNTIGMETNEDHKQDVNDTTDMENNECNTNVNDSIKTDVNHVDDAVLEENGNSKLNVTNPIFTETDEHPQQNVNDDVTMEAVENTSNLTPHSEGKDHHTSSYSHQMQEIEQDEISDHLTTDCNNENNVEINNKSATAESTTESSYDNMKDENLDSFDCQNSESEMFEDTEMKEENENDDSEKVMETRKVPKLSLKLPKPGSFLEAEDSDDSEKLTLEVERPDSETENDNDVLNSSNIEEAEYEEPSALANGDNQFPIAGSEIPVIELELEQPLDKFDAHILLQKCLKMTILSCIFCNHARKIAVNGKQLALHCIAEHRFSAVVNSITAEELIPQSFVNRFKESLEELEHMFFNLESGFSNEAVTFSHLFECFQCYFSTTVHKELYLHNRKFHSKNLLLCIMCKSNFFSYSELICHLCPGLYVLDYDLQFRCCMCVNDDLPSSFRLMVHLRKRHNVCDVCLEMCHNQYRLSNHVWKHKLNHFCYRCGIAYRNKPDITRHLFWKHGTESMLCKKCLQKKWPHMYHFCVPPTSFACDECTQTFSRAVSLKVHKRLHTDEKKHHCTFEDCTEAFISKKLMLKHEARHRDPPEEVKVEEEVKKEEEEEETKDEVDVTTQDVIEEDKVEEKPKPKIDVLDLPALNLSESDSSDSEAEPAQEVKNEEKSTEGASTPTAIDEFAGVKPDENDGHDEEAICVQPLSKEQDVPEDQIQDMELENTNNVIQNIWDNFKNYQASKDKIDNRFVETEKPEDTFDIPVPIVQEEEVLTSEMALRDHDYCLDPQKDTDPGVVEAEPALRLSESVDHDYCSPEKSGTVAEKPPLEPQLAPMTETVQPAAEEKKNGDSSSSSSSDGDSSSCTCGTNCSCSSSSSSSSSSSDSSNSDSSTEEGRQKQLARRKKRKERAKKLKEKEKELKKANEKNKPADVVPKTEALPVLIVETPIRESDLETDESETDEEFYDKAPHKIAKKIQEEKRQQMLAVAGPNSESVPLTIPNGTFIESTSRPPTPPAGSLTVEEEAGEERRKKKSKSKKRKKHKNERRELEELDTATTFADVPIPPYYQQFHQQRPQTPTVAPLMLSLPRNSPIPSPSATVTTPTLSNPYHSKIQGDHVSNYVRQESSDSSLRASKRRRVPNKFYGYSSDEEDKEKAMHSPFKWRKLDLPQTPRSPMVVPPITIKTTPQQPVATPPPQPPLTVEPISIKTGTHLSDFRVRQRQKPRPKPVSGLFDGPSATDSGSDSNDSSSEDQAAPVSAPGMMVPLKPLQPQLYCYCRCPYDEVSEMIGCDASDCAIEWFHFECVGIMVPPKGQWYCPDCRKKKQQRQMLHSN